MNSYSHLEQILFPNNFHTKKTKIRQIQKKILIQPSTRFDFSSFGFHGLFPPNGATCPVGGDSGQWWGQRWLTDAPNFERQQNLMWMILWRQSWLKRIRCQCRYQRWIQEFTVNLCEIVRWDMINLFGWSCRGCCRWWDGLSRFRRKTAWTRRFLVVYLPTTSLKYTESVVADIFSVDTRIWEPLQVLFTQG
jgi:hypothetical protein